MSWCTAAEVAELISVARLRGDVDAATRKAADLRFIDICTTAINAGDVLMQIATETTAAPGLRLNAILAAQPLITTEGWNEGGRFSDRGAVTRLLLRWTADPSLCGNAQVSTELLRSQALIASLEFPTEQWQQWIQECAYALVAGDLASAAKLHAVVNESYRNYALWSFLANDFTGFVMQAQLTALPQRTMVMGTFLELMRKRPRPSAEHEIASTSNCVLLSAEMRHFVMGNLLACVEDTRLAGAAAVAGGFVGYCTIVFAVASRLVVDVESAVNVFRCSSFFLGQLQASAAPAERSDGRNAFTEQLMECLLSTLQLFPEVASNDVQAEELLACLMHFMIPAAEVEGADAAQISTELLEFFMDDEAVPLGCGSGDVAHLAGAVLELYLEHNVDQRPAAIATLNAILRSTPNIHGALADAVALALRSVSRVYEAAGAVVVDALDTPTQAELLTQVSQLLLRAAGPHAHVMLMDALTHCFYGSHNEDLCCQLVQLLQRLHTAATAAMPSEECAVCVRCTCIYEAGRLVEEARTRPWCKALLSPAWVRLTVEQLAVGDTFGVFCAASTLCTLLYVTPDCALYLCESGAAWVHGLRQLCRHATLRGVAVLITLALRHIAGISAVATPSSAHSCLLVATSCSTVMAFCQLPSPSRHLVLRSVVDFVVAHMRVYLRGDGCANCAEHLAGLTAPLFTEAFSAELSQDEPSCRSFTACATLLYVAFGAVQPAMATAAPAALLRVLQHAVAQTYASQTISCVCGHLALVLVLQPDLVEEVAAHVLRVLFTSNVDLVEGRKGANYSGAAFLLSLFFLRCPQCLLHAAGATRPAPPDDFPLVVQRGFGWWLNMAPFMDVVQLPYFAAACCRIASAVVAAPVGTGVSTGRLASCRQFILPSVHVKKLPLRPFTNLSVLQHLCVAWVDLERRYSSTSKPQLLDQGLQPYVSGVDRHYTSLCGVPFTGSAAAAVLKTAPAETIAAFVDYLSQQDGGAAINTARRLLSELVR
ncbi:putative mitochondrial hypothetical protein [Leptomonas pyrrhocoris]|uniref:Importin N-terminal domain-containing protein n=1 Tax=Leptomonas pyrrhocoris TaxID=157538 RepID=A0A0M9G867_LEPPY|nr:putative mitochondrial hypothetical protein [Leptomonas pyrrhocoris]XP_015662876.1 putative mitochondrial hypothetical protein [Leptomonas pyrrhocoris]KPA84436.1 putative mitochondrial hypothetical protein [Leptomonas pyrrhocoris]KPA84437.1 putative mitochondrial hypothetical protein [Leptomonas pyrrhocoris]|eukprot:XP_015662875.1 putative mitochondrial hypothetical protein [Leptomonas pyrrhocoris]